MNKPTVIDLPSYADDRGVLNPVWNNWGEDGISEAEFGTGDTCAGVDLRDVKRAYFINNSQKGVVRGFHYHQRETKYFVVLRGMAKFVCAPFEDDRGRFGKIETFVLSERKPQLLVVPHHHANGWMSLTDDCLLLALSSSTFKQSKNDDTRYSPDLFGDVWSVKPR